MIKINLIKKQFEYNPHNLILGEYHPLIKRLRCGRLEVELNLNSMISFKNS